MSKPNHARWNHFWLVVKIRFTYHIPKAKITPPISILVLGCSSWIELIFSSCILVASDYYWMTTSLYADYNFSACIFKIICYFNNKFCKYWNGVLGFWEQYVTEQGQKHYVLLLLRNSRMNELKLSEKQPSGLSQLTKH